MRRSLLLVLGLSAGATLFAACGDLARAPSEPAARPPAVLAVPPIALNGGHRDTTVSFSVTIDPTVETVYSDGISTIRFPARSICDPATSTYGPSEWDAPCAPATAPITVPVSVVIKGGRMTLHFHKDLRFAPSADPTRQVMLTMNVPAVKESQNLRRFAIFWMPTGTMNLVDEARTDPSVVTRVNRSAGQLVRRLKHFSGYNVHLGIYTDCTPYVDDGCVTHEGEVNGQ